MLYNGVTFLITIDVSSFELERMNNSDHRLYLQLQAATTFGYLLDQSAVPRLHHIHPSYKSL